MAIESESKPEGGPPTPAPTPPSQSEKKISNAELKAKAKAEKAARRAAAKPKTPPVGKPPEKQDSAQPAAQKSSDKAHTRPSETTPSQKPEKKKPVLPECFSHLPVATRLPTVEAEKDVHDAVLDIGQLMSSFTIRNSIERVEATLLAFKEVLESYETPQNNTFSRHFTSHVLNPQIEHLTECRPLSFSMGNAIRWLKLQVSKVDIELSDDEAKKQLGSAIDKFILQKVTMSHRVVAANAGGSIKDGDAVLVYGGHHLVEEAFLSAQNRGTKFRVLVVDDEFEPNGAGMVGRLRKEGLIMTYCPDMSAALVLAQLSTKAMITAEAVFEDGSVYARAGTSDVAIAAQTAGREVLALCPPINFTDRMPTDSFTYNEVDPEMATSSGLRLLYDITKSEDISEIILEEGTITTEMIPDILKKFDFL